MKEKQEGYLFMFLHARAFEPELGFRLLQGLLQQEEFL